MTTKDEIVKAIEELKEAYLEFAELGDKQIDLAIKLKKAMKRLSLARDEVRAIKL